MLSNEEIKDIAKSPKNKDKLVEIKKLQDRVRFHSCSLEIKHEKRRFLSFVQNLGLTSQKMAKFKSLMVAPYPSVSLVDEINESLKKVFDGIDPDIDMEFVAAEYKTDAESYTRGVCDINFFRDRAWDVYVENHNSIMVVDLPRDQKTDRPEPYLYFRDPSTLHDIGEVDGHIEWIVFVEDEVIYFYDDTYYRGFEFKESKLGPIIFENAHELNTCPAEFFFSSIVSNEKRYLKKHPISNKVSDLDWFLFMSYAKKHLDSYAGFPVYWGFNEDCEFEDNENNLECEGGFLRKIDTKAYVWGMENEIMACPKCSQTKLVGPGTFYSVDPPSEYNDKANLRDPVGIVGIDVKSLKQNTDEVQRLGSEIYSSVVGNSYDIASQMSLNEMQIQYLIEGKRSAIKNFKVNWENAQKWATSIICKLRYGNYYLSSKVSYGNDWYLFEEHQLLEMYEKGKSEGWSKISLDYLEDLAYKTKFKDNPEHYHRYRILNAIMPVRHKTDKDVYEMYNIGLIDFENFYIQINFSSLINRFEIEYGNILDFGPSSIQQKVELITNLLKNYINDSVRKQAERASREAEVSN